MGVKKCLKWLKKRNRLRYVATDYTDLYIDKCNAYVKLNKEYSEELKQKPVELTNRNISPKVWMCWLQGYEKAPLLVKACINSVRDAVPRDDFVLIDEKNIDDYISFPDYIKEKAKQGIIGMAHYSDLIRVELLCRYGGIWLDATVLCTSPDFLAYIRSLPLFVYQEMDLTQSGIQPVLASNWLIASQRNNKILLLTRELLFSYWKKEKRLRNYFIFHLFFAMAARKYKEEWDKVPLYNNCSPHTLQFELNKSYSEERWNQIAGFSALHKLNHHKICDGKNTFYEYIVSKYVG